MTPLRILLAQWAPFHAGAEVAAERLAKGLRAAGHEVLCVVGTQGETLRRLREEGLRVEHVPLALTDKWRFWRHWRAQSALLRLLRRERFDLVHANDLPTHQMVALAARRAGVPRICHHRFVFDGPSVDWMNKFGAERHLFVSGYLQASVAPGAKSLHDVPQAVVYDGLELPPAPTADARRAARQELGLPADRVVVLFAGQVAPVKGVKDLLHAWSRLDRDRADRAELILVGDDLKGNGAYRREMESLATALAIGVRFAGFQRNVPTWLRAADVAVVPSLVEPLGNATLEAMAHALPVAASRVGGIPEMVVDGETGRLAAPESPSELAAVLAAWIDDPETRLRLGAAGRRRCEERFSLGAHVAAVVAQYRATLSGRAAHAVA